MTSDDRSTGDAAGAPAVGREEFVRAMSQHVASVCVVTTGLHGRRFGLTATAVSSVCLTPPRVLACVNKSGLTHGAICEAGHFCINVLGEDQEHLAKLFAGLSSGTADRFAGGKWTTLVTGSPVLCGATAAFDCRIAGKADQPTHTVFFGDVLGTALSPGQDPLLYGARRFRQLRKAYSGAASLDDALYL